VTLLANEASDAALAPAFEDDAPDDFEPASTDALASWHVLWKDLRPAAANTRGPLER